MLSEKFGRFSDPELTHLHQELIDFRNKLYAHRHPDFLKIHIRVEVQDLGQMIKHDFYPDVEDSDFDFAVVLKDDKVNAFKEIDKITDAVYPLILEYNADITYKPMNNFLLNQPDKIFYYFVRTEGKAI